MQGRLPIQVTPQLIKRDQERIILNESLSPASAESSTRHQCRFCDVAFVSRNALFRHVRSDPICSLLANDGNPYSQLCNPKRQTIVLLFQYHSTSTANRSTHDDGDVNQQSEAMVAGDALRGAIKQAIESHVHNEYDLVTSGVEIISTTQATVSKHRHLSLAQETCCAAAGDVMVLSFLAPAVITCNKPNREDRERQKQFSFGLLTKTNEILLHNATKSSNLLVQILSVKLCASDSRLHAERSCTQRVYHYLLPLQWLPRGKEIERWWIQSEEYSSRLPASDCNGRDETRAPTRPPSGSLHLLKDALRSAESATVTSREHSVDLIRDAAGRFGALASKMRRPFHNYADPHLRGDASPNNEPVWRVVDRARVVQFQTWKDPLNDQESEVFAVLEFRGDDFLPQQVRRIVGTALAITHGWLPSDFFDLSTRPDVFVETPLAPDGRLYLAGARFHFEELRNGGKGIFETEADGLSNQQSKHDSLGKPNHRIQQQLLSQLTCETIRRKEATWLQKLQDVVAPLIRKQLNGQITLKSAGSRLGSTHEQTPPPECYATVLTLLRSIIASGKWPTTSRSRSNVIREVATGKRGSFTVVNPKVGASLDSGRLPLGNALFPDLVEAVFELELSLSEQELDGVTANGHVLKGDGRNSLKRPSSSHCAINCNAEFTPHVDSGRGAGQSLSMIVGLGNYVGGELAVEGANHDIRFHPLEFDGWKLRHWTIPFEGERFSLVWFTPEPKGKVIRDVKISLNC
jgi:tRNA U38,U39,U40 pseudouridine synthase TruA